MQTNPMMQILNRSKLANGMQPVKNALRMVQSAGNPNAMMQQLLSRNPQYAQAMKLVQESGGDAKAAFYKLAEQTGVDPEDILSALK